MSYGLRKIILNMEMKISSRLPQFEKEKAVIAVVAKQGADFYLASQGVIRKINAVKMEKPRFGKKSGRVAKKQEGKEFYTGDIDKIEREVIKIFIRELKTAAELAKAGAIYIFSPVSALSKIREIPAKTAQKVRALIKGNYFNLHPFVLLEKIGESVSEGPVKPIKKEAAKVLERGLAYY